MPNTRQDRSRVFLSSVLASALFFGPAHLFSQSCQGVVGTWTDSYSYTWTLQQDGVQITGRMDDHEACGDDYNDQWTVNGSIDGSGNMSLTLTPDYVCELYGHSVQHIYLTVSNASPGCNTSNPGATISNDEGYSDSYNWSWSTGCSAPSTESSYFAGWGPDVYASAGQWAAALFGGPQLYYSGRVVYEGTGAAGNDTCYFDGSPYAPFESVTGGAWPVNSANGFGYDYVGWLSSTVSYYRSVDRDPCGATVYQNMFIECNGESSILYKQNVLGADIGNSTVSSSRDGQTYTRDY